MVNSKITDLSFMASSLELIKDKQAEIIMTNDGRILTVNKLNEENKLLLKNGFRDRDIPQIAKQRTKLADRMLTMGIETKYFRPINAEKLEQLIMKQQIVDYYQSKGISLEEILAITEDYKNDTAFFITLLESKLISIQDNLLGNLVNNYSLQQQPTKINYNNFNENKLECSGAQTLEVLTEDNLIPESKGSSLVWLF